MPKINPRIKSIDDLLGLDAAEERPCESNPTVSFQTKNTIIAHPPQSIRAFRGHPFRLYEGDRLNDLVESISEHGVLNPVIIRKIERDEDGFEYEMLAGHNRQNAADQRYRALWPRRSILGHRLFAFLRRERRPLSVLRPSYFHRSRP